MKPGQKFLTYSIEGEPLCIQGQGTPPKVGDLFLQVRVRAVIPFPGYPDYLVVVLTPLPK